MYSMAEGVQMVPRGRRCDKAFKVAVAQAIPAGEKSVRELSEELGIKGSVLRRRVHGLEEMGGTAFPGSGSPEVGEGYGIVKLRKWDEELESENGLLKNPGVLEPRSCARPRFLKERRGGFGPIGKACRILRGVEVGYCEHLYRRKPDRRIEPRRSRGSWGRRVLKVMRKLGQAAKGTKGKWRCWAVGPGNPRTSLVDRAFTVAAGNMLRAGGIACVDLMASLQRS